MWFLCGVRCGANVVRSRVRSHARGRGRGEILTFPDRTLPDLPLLRGYLYGVSTLLFTTQCRGARF